ncbi:MAG: peptidoglycan editing factor PgeF [Pseudomonadota bacterium]|nr:peptidoglycan editing factor PgeF [Pseudomonadota bacterium]
MILPVSLPGKTLKDLPGIRHGFFTRHGGVSTGPCASLNCARVDQDTPEAVAENRRRVVSALGVSRALLLLMRQVHGTRVVTVRDPWQPGDAPEADALVTDRPALVLGVLTADCAPVLLADPAAGVVGAAHAGWRGAVDRVVQETVKAMVALGADPARMIAAVGPCIGPASYEVTENFTAPFLQKDSRNDQFFIAAERPGHLVFNLPGYVLECLGQAGVSHAVWTGHDTLADPALFFSHRRGTVSGKPEHGRQISVIALA